LSAARGYASVWTPFGSRRLCILCSGDGVIESEFSADEARFTALLRARGLRLDRRHDLAREAAAQVRAYFKRRRTGFDLPLVLNGTPLEIAIWRAVAATESGMLVSYGEVARAIGRPRGHRAVARAMARAPLDLFVPAHRVIGADGTVRGDPAATGLRRMLLQFEGHGAIASKARI
jgi:methylated-DNA-[protein]-cysteine S-methyltransferase